MPQIPDIPRGVAPARLGFRHAVPPLTPCRLLAGTGILAAAADLLLWRAPAGAGLAVFALLLWTVLLWNRPPGIGRHPKDWIAMALMLTTAAQTVIETGFANFCLLLALTIYASAHFLHRNLHPFWRRWLEGVFGLAWLPAGMIFGGVSLKAWMPTSGILIAPRQTKAAWRWLGAVVPAAVVTLPFALLLLGGNAILFATLRDWLSEISGFLRGFKLPEPLRILFWCATVVSMLALLGKGTPSRLLAWMAQLCPDGSLGAPADPVVAIWRTRLLLIGVNVLFFFANTTDVLYLWAEARLPQSVTPSQFVHQGVYSLIASVVLAGGVLSIVFVQHPAVCRAPGQRLLAHLWIVQNLVLVSSVVLRLKLYVDAFELSLLRVYVVCFLLVASAGFVLLALRIHQERGLSWLVGGNALSVFILFFVMQVWDEHRFVARWNVAAAASGEGAEARVLDTAYLATLGPAAWPYLARVAGDRNRFGERAADAASALLAEQEARFKSTIVPVGWRAWQWKRHVAAQDFD